MTLVKSGTNRAKEIYMHPERTVKDKRLLMNLMFSSLKLKDGELTITYSKAFEILSKFAPAWKKFEHKQKPPENEKPSSSAVITEILPAQNQAEPQKKIRTAKNTDVPTQFGLSVPVLSLGLRVVDEITTYFRTTSEYHYIPNLKDGIYNLVRPSAAELTGI